VFVNVDTAVEVGCTTSEFPLTVPMPWSMLTVVAPVVAHRKVALVPGPTLAGLTEKLEIVGWTGAVTVATVVEDADPKAFVAVRM